MTTDATTPLTSRGVLFSKSPGAIVLAIPGTDYQVHLQTRGTLTTEAGKRIVGVIRVQARRIDVVDTGGRYLEPVYGRPRRVQGSIEAIDKHSDTLSVRVHEQMVIVCKTNGRQKAADFSVGQFVSMEAEPGATFEVTAG